MLLLLLLLVLLAVVILLSYTLRASSEAPTANNQGLCLEQGEEQRRGGGVDQHTLGWRVGDRGRKAHARFGWWSWWTWDCTQDQNISKPVGCTDVRCSLSLSREEEHLWVGGNSGAGCAKLCVCGRVCRCVIQRANWRAAVSQTKRVVQAPAQQTAPLTQNCVMHGQNIPAAALTIYQPPAHHKPDLTTQTHTQTHCFKEYTTPSLPRPQNTPHTHLPWCCY